MVADMGTRIDTAQEHVANVNTRLKVSASCLGFGVICLVFQLGGVVLLCLMNCVCSIVLFSARVELIFR